jgi:hypothetical protein
MIIIETLTLNEAHGGHEAGLYRVDRLLHALHILYTTGRSSTNDSNRILV